MRLSDSPSQAMTDGQLYLATTRPFLGAERSAAEAAFIAQRLPPGAWCDLGCGHGRHLAHLPPSTVGVDADVDALRLANGRAMYGRLEALPFPDAAFTGMYAWYNAITACERDSTVAYLREACRCLASGGLLIIQGSNPARASATSFQEVLVPACGLIRERSVWCDAARRDDIDRELITEDGQVFALRFSVRYYDVAEWTLLCAEASLAVDWVCGSIAGELAQAESPDLILGVRHG